MHEVGVVRAVLNRALREAQDGEQITRVEISLGELASYTPQALSFYFSGMARGTQAEGATLNVLSRKTDLHCQACRHTVPLTIGVPTCPGCGGPLAAPGLRDLRLEAVECHDPATGATRRVALRIVVREEPHS